MEAVRWVVLRGCVKKLWILTRNGNGLEGLLSDTGSSGSVGVVTGTRMKLSEIRLALGCGWNEQNVSVHSNSLGKHKTAAKVRDPPSKDEVECLVANLIDRVS